MLTNTYECLAIILRSLRLVANCKPIRIIFATFCRICREYFFLHSQRYSPQCESSIRRAIYSAQSPIGRNIAVIRNRYAIHVIDINVKHVHRQYPLSHPELSGTVRCILELLCISNNENELPGFSKSDVDTMINALCTC